MNHIEDGIYSHTIDISNPHKVTAAQIGLGNVQNFGLATEDEAKQGISNAKYMTPSLTQAVLSANINSIAYANSADGTDGFTTAYPNLNLLKSTKSQAYTSTGTASNSSSNIYQLDGVLANILNKQLTITYNYAITNSSGTWSGTIRPTYGFGGANQSVSNTNLSGTHKETITLTDVSQTSYGITTSGLPAGTKVTITNLKVEFGSISTPWIPSSSEVTTADWPKYIGFSNTIKTNKSASDYTWFPVKDSELTNKVDSHVNNKANPHSVTASQVGAYSKTEADVKFATGQSLTDLSSIVLHNTGDETISGKKTFSEVVDMPKFADSYVAFFANKGSGNTVTFTAPWDCTAEVELFYHGWGYSGGEWEIGISAPSSLTKIYEATGYTNGHNSQAMAMPAKAIYSGLTKGQQYTFDKRDVSGRAGGSSRPMMIVKLYRN
ncbi:hypothetical protein [Lactococcus lactis]|nr:hypothetical protein [Lactococcus lactis]